MSPWLLTWLANYKKASRSGARPVLCRNFINIYIINRTFHGRLGLRILSSCAESISHSFALLTRERYFQHSKIKFVAPRGHEISSMYNEPMYIRLRPLTLTLIIPDITKTFSNNCVSCCDAVVRFTAVYFNVIPRFTIGCWFLFVFDKKVIARSFFLRKQCVLLQD